MSTIPISNELKSELYKDLPVFKEVDVLVAGGGPAGVGAALAAARNGASTMIVEQFNCLGGVATAAGHGHISRYDEIGTGRRIIGGIAHEIGTRIAADGFGAYSNYGINFEIEGMKLLLEKMTEEAGVSLLYYTFFCDSLVNDGQIIGAVIQNKNGRQIIKAKRVIDCTGDGDVAFHANCEYDFGRDGDNRCQPVTLMFTVGGVEWQRTHAFSEAYKAARPGDRDAWKMKDIYAEAVARGDMRPYQTGNMGWTWTPTRPDHVCINFTHVIHVDSTKAEELTRATIEARKQAYETIEVYRKYIPGMENCYMISTPNSIGIRESRRIMGDYLITAADVKNQREFEDNICYGSFFVDIHGIDNPGMDPTVWYPPKGFKYHIPYRILLPRGIENLLTAGRCVSCSHIALGSIRVMVPCIGMGEAAGTAAALSLRENITPRQLNIGKLQKQLRQQGAILFEEDIVKAATTN